VVIETAARPGVFARFRLAFRRRPEPEAAEPEAIVAEPELHSEPVAAEPEPEPEPVAETPAQPEPEPVAVTPEPVAEAPEPEPEPAPVGGEEALVAALDSLGMAHHRPYSRA
jgi:outer membrane biosynthesis protein TonB